LSTYASPFTPGGDYRQDIPQSQLSTLPSEEPKVVLFCELKSGTIPATWSVWPVSRSLGWLNKMEGTLGEEDFTIVMEEAS
jgi:hypothetical protein